MAGSYGSKQDPKKSFNKNNNEILKDFPNSPAKKSEHNLFGTLFPGQSIEVNKKETTNISWNREFLTKSTTQEQAIFVNQHSKEVEKAINDLRLEIKNLIKTTENLNQEIIQSAEQNVADFSEYQLNFFQRIKIIVTNFRQNITEASVWLESFNHKKNKKNAFWNKAKSKNGGEQYLMSSEHSASRSAN
ncbi:MAG: DUF5660 domain-containing protein [Candidatus Shapirobacteria bacterium]|nr:DUF5660 domain-containing protein [Candidatus Shapirobacteria bacterium]MDD4382647.1 DUF5660 domain-containing protein [Candidatus Shapirobacteria bacterium]